MKICPACGNSMENDAVFCSECGASLPVQAETAPAGEAVIFCPECGERLPADAAFCANCGASIQTQPARPQYTQPQYAQPQYTQPQYAANPAYNDRSGGKKPKSKRLLIGIAAAVAAVAVVAIAIFAAVNLFASPASKFLSYQQDLLLSELSGTQELLTQASSDGFSSDLTISVSVDNAQINDYLRGSSIGLKLDIDPSQQRFVANGDLALMGSQVLSGTVTYDRGELGVMLPEVDNTYYVMDLEEVIYTLTGQDVDLGSMQPLDLNSSEWKQLEKTYLKLLCSVVTKDNVTVKKNTSVRLSGLHDSFTGTVYTFTPTSDDIETMLLALADQLESDQALRKLLWESFGPTLLSEAFYSTSKLSSEAALDDLLVELADELRDEAKWIGQEVEKSGFQWTLAVEGGNVRMIELSVDNGDNAFVYEAEGKASDGRTELIYIVDYGYTRNLVQRSYTEKGKTLSGELTIYDYSESVTLTYDLDTGKKSALGLPYGKYVLDIPDEDIYLELDVEAGASGSTDHIVTFSTDNYWYGLPFETLELTVNATDKGSASKPSQTAVDISSYSRRDFIDLLGELSEAIESQVISELMPYGWY